MLIKKNPKKKKTTKKKRYLQQLNLFEEWKNEKIEKVHEKPTV